MACAGRCNWKLTSSEDLQVAIKGFVNPVQVWVIFIHLVRFGWGWATNGHVETHFLCQWMLKYFKFAFYTLLLNNVFPNSIWKKKKCCPFILNSLTEQQFKRICCCQLSSLSDISMLHLITVPGTQTWLWNACWSPVGWTWAVHWLDGCWTLAGHAVDQLYSASQRPAHLQSTSQPVGLSMDLTVYWHN